LGAVVHPVIGHDFLNPWIRSLRFSEPPGSLLSLSSQDHHCSILRLFLAFQTHSQYCTNWMRNSGLPDLSCDGLLAQSRYFLHQEQSGPAISQPLTPDPDFPPDTLNIFAIHSRLHRCQRPEDIATSASKGEEPVNRDCSSR
jgi:hypothetical protein